MPGARIDGDERITLRTVEEEDVPFVQREATNPKIRYPMGKPLRTRGEVEEFLEEENADRFLVCLDGDDAGPDSPEEGDTRRIGCVGVEDAAWKRPELVY